MTMSHTELATVPLALQHVFPLVLIDEASQCREPEALIPIMKASHCTLHSMTC